MRFHCFFPQGIHGAGAGSKARLLYRVIYLLTCDGKPSFLHKDLPLKWQPTPVLLPGKSHGSRSLVGYSPWGCKELDTTERLHFTSLALQRSCSFLQRSQRGIYKFHIVNSSYRKRCNREWIKPCNFPPSIVSPGKGCPKIKLPSKTLSLSWDTGIWLVEFLCVCMLSDVSRVRLFVTLWTLVHQALLSMEFSRPASWSGLPCPL